MSDRPRVAYVSPLPPQGSGIADYSGELLPRLAAHVDLELVADEGVKPVAGLAGAFPVHRPRDLADLLTRGRCDAALYHLGNNRDFHRLAYRSLLAHPTDRPAVLVLHEYVLHHLVRDITLHEDDPAGYVEALRWCCGRTGETVGRRAVATGVPLDPFRYPLFERAVDSSSAVIVHNRTVAERVLASRSQARVTVIPHHLSLDALPATSREEARQQLGIGAEDFVVATFGFLTEAKRLPVLLRAFARLRREEGRGRARLQLVGEVSPHYHDFRRVFVPELRGGVEVTGRLELDRFLLQMAACDVAVNLRHPTAGETSGTLVRLLGLGKPVIVTRAGAFAEVPDGCCAKLDLDEDEEEALLAYLRALAADPALSRAMGENARKHVAGHTPEASAEAYATVLRQCVEEGWLPPPCPPPLSPYPEHDLFSELVRTTAADLADLELADGEEKTLGPVARAMVELGLDLAGSGRAS